MKLFDICQRAGISCPEHLKHIEVEGISSRSNEIKQNYVFVCLRGTKLDGHDYIEQAFMRGACAVMIEDEKYACDRSILVESTRRALSRTLNVLWGEPTKRLKFIGVTGTNGKTSVSAMIKNIFDVNHISCEVIGTLNCSSFSEKNPNPQANLTTPDPEELYPMLLGMARAGVEYVVMEASSHALKLCKLDPINFEIGIFTNLSEDHLDFHLNMEDYFKSKLLLFDRCRVGIINIDDEYGKRLFEVASCEKYSCSMEQSADFVSKDIISLAKKGSKYTVWSAKGEFDILCKIPGEFSIMNSLQASACALALDIDNRTISSSFDLFDRVRGRLERIEIFEERGFSVFIDYAHTPDALLKLLQTAKALKKGAGRIILLFGCGGDREKQKRSLMGAIASENADITIITSDNPRSEDPIDIINDILVGIDRSSEYVAIPDRAQAIRTAILLARKDDIVLLAGKGHEDYEIPARGRAHFDEREILRRIKNYKEE